jgi:hypothetical protein
MPGQAPDQMNTQDLAEGQSKRGFGPDLSMKEVPFTQEGIQNFLGPRFQVKPSRQGNFQINIGNMRASSDDDKITLLYKARELLRSRGFAVTAKLTFRSSRTQRFENWPCLWVDQNPDSSHVQKLQGILQRMAAKLEEAGINLGIEDALDLGGGDAFEQDREIEPTEDDNERTAMIQRNKQLVAEGKNLRSTQDPLYREPTLNQASPGFPGDQAQHGGKVRPGRSPAPIEDAYTEPTDEDL